MRVRRRSSRLADKYTQIARILSPIVLTIKHVDKLMDNERIVKGLITPVFKSPENLKRTILHDFFRNGFDGSGADNFFDAGMYVCMYVCMYVRMNVCTYVRM